MENVKIKTLPGFHFYFFHISFSIPIRLNRLNEISIWQMTLSASKLIIKIIFISNLLFKITIKKTTDMLHYAHINWQECVHMTVNSTTNKSYFISSCHKDILLSIFTVYNSGNDTKNDNDKSDL